MAKVNDMVHRQNDYSQHKLKKMFSYQIAYIKVDRPLLLHRNDLPTQATQHNLQPCRRTVQCLQDHRQWLLEQDIQLQLHHNNLTWDTVLLHHLLHLWEDINMDGNKEKCVTVNKSSKCAILLLHHYEPDQPLRYGWVHGFDDFSKLASQIC